jgi:hypothetical protein
MDLFGHLNNLIYKNKKWNDFTEEERKTFNIYMINKFISMNPSYTGVVDMLQRYTGDLNQETVFNFYYNFLPKQKMYFKYIKGTKTEKDDQKLEILSKYFECSLSQAAEYFNLLSEENIQDILNKYGFEQPTIKKTNVKKRKQK